MVFNICVHLNTVVIIENILIKKVNTTINIELKNVKQSQFKAIALAGNSKS